MVTFFFSYARLNKGAYLDKFAADLLRLLQERTGRYEGDLVFIDHEMEPGVDWSQQIRESLRTCQVFFSVESPAYFQSEYCGKEWSVFRKRLEEHARSIQGSIPPLHFRVGWLPIRDSQLKRIPQTVQKIQDTREILGLYAKEGIEYLLRRNLQAEYQEVLTRLADLAIDAWEKHPLPPANEIPDLSEIKSAFGSLNKLVSGKMTGRTFDVFLSYNIRDREFVEKIASFLRDKGLEVFSDRSSIPLGAPGQRVLQEVIHASRSVIVFQGRELGPRQQEEIGLALLQEREKPNFRIIPVLLPGADPGLSFLDLRSRIDLREGLSSVSVFENLAAVLNQGANEPPLEDESYRIQVEYQRNLELEAWRQEQAQEQELLGSVFISYSHKDNNFVDRLAGHLSRDRIAYWRDDKDILVGDVIERAISEGIQKNDLFLIVLTPSSIASEWVQRELDEASHEAIEEGKAILPILAKGLRSDDVPKNLSYRKYVDFNRRFVRGYGELLNSIKGHLQRQRSRKDRHSV